MCSGREQHPRLISIFRDIHHLTISRLFIPTHFCRRLYPSSLWINKIFSLRGIWLRRPSSLWTVTRGFALRAWNTFRMCFLVWSETPLLWPEDRRARPSWKKLESAPPMWPGQGEQLTDPPVSQDCHCIDRNPENAVQGNITLCFVIVTWNFINSLIILICDAWCWWTGHWFSLNINIRRKH